MYSDLGVLSSYNNCGIGIYSSDFAINALPTEFSYTFTDNGTLSTNRITDNELCINVKKHKLVLNFSL